MSPAFMSRRSRGFGGRSRPTQIFRMHFFTWPPPSRAWVDLTRRVPRPKPVSLSTRPTPFRATEPSGQALATTRRFWPSLSSVSKACARRGRRNDRPQLAAILAVDVVGHGRLMGEDEARTGQPQRSQPQERHACVQLPARIDYVDASTRRLCPLRARSASRLCRTPRTLTRFGSPRPQYEGRATLPLRFDATK